MPPKAAKKGGESEADERPKKVSLPERSLLSPEYLAGLLSCAKTDRVEELTEKIAVAVWCPAHRTDLQQRALVDMHFDNIMFAARRGWGPRKTAAFLGDATDLHELVVSSDDVCEAKLLLKKQLLTHRTAALNIAPHSHDLEASPEASQPPLPPRRASAEAAAAAAAASAAEPSDAAGGGEEAAAAAAEKAASSSEVVFFTLDDLAAVAEHASTGLLQHHTLLRMVFTSERQPGEALRRSVRFRTPMQPRRLGDALVPDAYRNMVKEREDALLRDIEEVRAREAAARQAEAERAAAEREGAREAEEKAEEERAARLVLDDADKTAAVEAVRADIVASLKERKEALIARLKKVEEEVAAVG